MPIVPSRRPPSSLYLPDGQHLQEVHPETRRSGRGRPRKGQQSPAAQLSREGVPCQRLFISGSGSSYFEVLPPQPAPEEAEEGRELSGEASTLPRTVQAQLEGLRARQDTHTIAPLRPREANPWLQRTGWADYLQGLSLPELATLLDPPRPDEPVLLRWEQALERIVADSQAAIVREEISVFDQALVNMFRDHATAEGRPLITKLQNRTYVRYRQAWIKLLTFIYRTSLEPFDCKLKTALRFRLTKLQRRKLESARRMAVAIDDPLPPIAADESAFDVAGTDA